MASSGLPEPPALGATALPPGTFAGTTVLVTGGGTGLGRATATEFARLGADLVTPAAGPSISTPAGRCWPSSARGS